MFQPAEEGGAGARASLEDGLTARDGSGEVCGLHSLPGLAVGGCAAPGPIVAAADRFPSRTAPG